MDSSEPDLCYICFQPHSVEQPLLAPCKCRLRVHKECLAVWQVHRSGTNEENFCRFCHTALPDWRPTLTPKDLDLNVPTVTVRFKGKAHKVKLYPGPEGKQRFQATLERITGQRVDDSVKVTFLCKAPSTEHDLAFRGFGAFDTVAHCAAVAAAEGVVSPADVIKASPQAAAEAAAEATAEAAADAAAEETEEADTVPLAPLAHSSSGRRSQRTGPAEHAGDSAGVHSSGAPVPPPTGAQPERELAPAAASLTSERVGCFSARPAAPEAYGCFASRTAPPPAAGPAASMPGCFPARPSAVAAPAAGDRPRDQAERTSASPAMQGCLTSPFMAAAGAAAAVQGCFPGRPSTAAAAAADVAARDQRWASPTVAMQGCLPSRAAKFPATSEITAQDGASVRTAPAAIRAAAAAAAAAAAERRSRSFSRASPAPGMQGGDGQSRSFSRASPAQGMGGGDGRSRSFNMISLSQSLQGSDGRSRSFSRVNPSLSMQAAYTTRPLTGAGAAAGAMQRSSTPLSSSPFAAAAQAGFATRTSSDTSGTTRSHQRAVVQQHAALFAAQHQQQQQQQWRRQQQEQLQRYYYQQQQQQQQQQQRRGVSPAASRGCFTLPHGSVSPEMPAASPLPQPSGSRWRYDDGPARPVECGCSLGALLTRRLSLGRTATRA